MSTLTKHTFEISGLGKAPFVITTQSAGNQAFFCQHCGTMLKHRYFVKSSDGITSVVGIDCLNKTDDSGLIAGAKRIEKERRQQVKLAQQEAKREEKLDKQRAHYKGKTHEEVRLEFVSTINNIKESIEIAIEEHDLYLELDKSSFGSSVLSQLTNGEAISNNVQRIITEILTKQRTNARKNSKAYKAALPLAESDFSALLTTIQPLRDSLAKTEQQMHDHNAEYFKFYN